MIPWRLKFSGIRDYTPTVMDFSEEADHILISGPNGAGKSTVIFCMGAVLYSSKVDLEGLKSNNLPSDQTWRARIELLFKNEGQLKVDAPLFIQFRLDIEQKPGAPIKKEFYIQKGDAIDQWERTTKFSSGDRNFNFTEYKQQVLYKYAVDPDAFYSIWYQKEVNQFALMHPEERFRIFSEMNGIDKIQKDWEASKELVKETELTLEKAQNQQKLSKIQLKQKQMELDRYNARNQRMEEGFKQYYSALLWLEDHHRKQIESLKQQVETLNENKDEKIDAKRDLELKLVNRKENLDEYESMIEQLELREEELERELNKLSEEIKAKTETLDSISKEIAEITAEVERIGMTEDEVVQKLAEAKEAYHAIQQFVQEKEELARSYANTLNNLTYELANLEVQIKEDERKAKEASELLDNYTTSSAIAAEIENNTIRLDFARDKIRQLENKEKVLEKELALLKQNKVLSPRQETSIRYFEKKGIDVYPLRELIELDETAKPSDEHRFDAIKYTLFINKKSFDPPTDLYHVPLPNIVPEKSIAHVPELHLQIKRDLNESLFPFAVKALWWTKTLFKKDTPSIKQYLLVDDKGVRGPQEEKRIILSEKVLKSCQKELESKIESIRNNIITLTSEMEACNKQNSTLFRIHESLRDAEAFMTKENERQWRKNKYNLLVKKKHECSTKQDALYHEINALNKEFAKWDQTVVTYKEYLAIYQKFEQEKEKIIRVQQLKQSIKELDERKKYKHASLTDLVELLDKRKRQKIQLRQAIDELSERLINQEREVEQIDRQIKAKSEEYLSNEEGYSKTNYEIQKLLDTAGKLAERFKRELSSLPQLTKDQALDMRDYGKTQYYNALNEKGIDETALENYQKMKEEYERSENVVKQSKYLLDEHTVRMERLKEELETAINMKIIGVSQKFVNYMSLFGFEGSIDWDMKIDRREQIHYALYIKARKEGHRGKMEDVSVKARGGKVGGGVSGGEESLSSLLFALALLQTIQASPGYIILDEFDSALDEGRKEKVFELYEQELNRKMIILTPKSHEAEYLYRFSKAYVVHHDPNIPKSKIFKVKRVKEKAIQY